MNTDLRLTTDLRLSAVLRDFARTMVMDYEIQQILDDMVTRMVDILPITSAGVTLIAPVIDPLPCAASDDLARRLEQLQTDVGEGPCRTAYESNRLVSVANLADDRLWDKYRPKALQAGVRAVFAFPLRFGDVRLGALDLYRDSPGPLDAEATEAAQTLADVVTAYLLNTKRRNDLESLLAAARETSLHDSLTGVANRTLLLERINHSIVRARRSKKKVAVLFVDLDRFKLVNDIHGHHTGDQLLVAVSERLTQALRQSDTLARVSGDEFVILCEDLDESSQAEVVAQRVRSVLGRPFSVSNGQIRVTASVGVAFLDDAEDDPDRALRLADIAMYQAKNMGGDGYQVTDAHGQMLVDNLATLEVDVSGALSRDELRVAYQPIVSTVDGRLTGVEALLRWVHPSRGLVPPVVLIPLAEQNRSIATIGRWVLDQACRDRHRWSEGGELSVNVSSQQLMSVDFAETVESVLDETGTPSGKLTLEITERAFFDDGERALVVLRDLRGLGVKIALDNFGTGYSSLSYLRRFPIDTVKIDKSFIADLGLVATSDAIVTVVIKLAHILGMTVVAEGVETAAQRQIITELGCDSCQGFYFARPMTATAVDALVSSIGSGADVHLP